MLRTTSGLSRSVGAWVSQVAASVGATLVATMIYSALPHAVLPAPAPELTSGGKFAARAVVPVAEDGLDAMPLPHVAPRLLTAAPASAEIPTLALPLHRAAWDGATPPAPTPERPAHSTKPVHVAPHPEPRRAVAARAEPSVATPAITDVASDAKAAGGIASTILSTARDVWSVTASAGGTLMAHVVPQIP